MATKQELITALEKIKDLAGRMRRATDIVVICNEVLGMPSYTLPTIPAFSPEQVEHEETGL